VDAGSASGGKGAAEAAASEDQPATVETAAAGAATATEVPEAAADGPALGSRSVWGFETGTGTLLPRSAIDVMTEVRDKVASGEVAEYEPIPLGLAPLDRSLGGGLRPGELLLIGGAQGTGKTTMALQMARNVAASGQAYVLYVCFEHDEADLLNRLVAMESALPHLPNARSATGAVRIQDVRTEVIRSWTRTDGGGAPDLAASPRLRPSLERIARYGSNLYLMRGSASASTVDNVRELVHRHREQSGGRRLLLVVDYLQKVPQVPEPQSESEKVTFVVNGLKDIALSERVPVIAIVAADKEGLKASRLRNYHLRGSSAINYEADIILILNEKYNIVAKVNIEFNPYQAQRFRDWVIVSIEKNRSGRDNLDVEFHKHFEYSCFDPTGRPVQEKLIEERLYTE
jgi:replicative DNA helicase